MDINITNIPQEVIMHILQYLPYSDRTALRLVCKSLYTITVDKSIVKEEYFIITGNYLKHKIIPLLLNSSRNFTSFKFVNVNFSVELADIFDKYGESLINLFIIDCEIEEYLFASILSKCTQLKSLHLTFCKSLLMPGTLFSLDTPSLPSVKYLGLEKCSYLTDEILHRFINICPNVEALNFNSNSICFHTALCKRFYKNNDFITKPSNCVLTKYYIIQILSSISQNIQKVDFSYTNIDSNSLQSICSIKGLNLQKLYLRECSQLSKYIPLELGTWQPFIIDLDISFCTGINNDTLQNICAYMTELKFLNIENCNGISDEGIMHIKNLRNLQSLNVSWCSLVTGKGLYECLNEHSLIQKFYARGYLFEEDNFLNLVSHFTNLAYLDLCECKISNKCLNILFKSCPKIENILLNNCKTISDDGLIDNETIINIEPSKVEIADSQNVVLPATHNSKHPVDYLSRLIYLSLEGCTNITDRAFEFALYLPDLRHLNIGGLKISASSIYSLVQKCTRIERLNLSDCNVDDKCVITAVKCLKRLKNLCLRNCVQLSDATLEAVLQHGTWLEKLDVTGCYMMSELQLTRVKELSTIKSLSYSVNKEIFKLSIPKAPPIKIN